jgi:LssY C-terminus
MRRSIIYRLLFISLVFASLGTPCRLAAQATDSAETPAAKSSSTSAPSTKQLLSKSLTLEGGKVWTDTGISLEPGQHIFVTAEGKLRYADAKAENGPDGLARGFKDLIRILPLNDAGRGVLIGRIGDADIAQPFLIGANKDVVAPVSGKFSIGINQASSDTGEGSYTVKVTVYAADSSAPKEVARSVSSMPGIDNALFAKIPRRIGDKEGNPGDMVNFLILGSEDDMKKTFTTAGWVKVDSDVRTTILMGALASFSKESYLTMPMSQLYLFDRPQDYGWAHAEPITVVASRNHLRIWKAPYTVNGQTLWVGAATHDVGFEKDQRNNGLTHKIDPNIDLERNYVEKTLSSTGLVAEVTHFLPKNPLQEARTATGGSFHSNGQVLVLKLASSDKGSSSSTANK